MTENEKNVTLEEEVSPAETVQVKQSETSAETTKPGFGAKVKEFFRKKAVNLKRKPQNIALLFLAIVSIYNLITLTQFSNAIITYAQKVEWVGLMVFVTTLFSILSLVAYLNSFPKLRKKNSKITVTMTEGGIKLNINLLMVAVLILMVVAMIVCDIVYHNLMNAFYVEEYINKGLTGDEAAKLVNSTLTLSIVHVVLLGVFLVLFFTMPLYRKLIMKIDTSVKVESAAENMNAIDLQD